MSKISLDAKTERQAMSRAAANPEAFGPIYSHYYKFIKRFLQAKLQNADIADDLTSQVFEKALKNLKNYSWQGVSVSAWLYKIAGNLLLDYYRQHKRRGGVAASVEELEPLLPNADLGPQEQAEASLNRQWVRELLTTLPQREQRVIYLKFYHGYTNKLIAELTQMSETNVGTIIHRSLAKLRQQASAS